MNIAFRHPAAAELFLRAAAEPPWQVISGGVERSFAPGGLPKLHEWTGKAQQAGSSCFASLPSASGSVWHLVVTASLTAQPAAMRCPPNLTIAADKLWLVWRLNDPMKVKEANAIAAQLAREIGGQPAIGEAVPLPGSVLILRQGGVAKRRIPVQMMPPFERAYRVVDGALRPAEIFAGSSPFVDADTIEAKPIIWLWPSMIPLGCLTLLGGAPGLGKSQTAIDIAARVSTGGAWPCGAAGERGSALVMEAEDDAASVVVPRLLAAGADLKRVGVGKLIDVSEGVEALEAERKRRKDLRLVVLSPIRRFIGEAELRGISRCARHSSRCLHGPNSMALLYWASAILPRARSIAKLSPAARPSWRSRAPPSPFCPTRKTKAFARWWRRRPISRAIRSMLPIAFKARASARSRRAGWSGSPKLGYFLWNARAANSPPGQ
jgi:hypothetical protein